MNDLPRVRELRKRSTGAETIAWWLLRSRQVLGLKLRRQCPLGPFVVDFYCSEAGLVIELDGSAHSQPSQIKKDRAKDRFLQSLGLRVLRLANGLALEDPDAFRRKVCEAVGGGPEVELPVPPHPACSGWQKRRQRATLSREGRGLSD
jgi:very-short-patch-repair endonuclease